MSLDDQFNKNDGSLLDTIDSALFNFNKKIATKWQDKTKRDKSDLEKVLYFGASLALSKYVINTENFLLVPVFLSSVYFGLNENKRPKSNKKEEMISESLNLPKKTIKFFYVSCYALSSSNFLLGIGALISGISTGNEELYIEGINNMLLGIGTNSYIKANYMAKSNIGTPKKKPKKKPVYEKIKNKIGELLPQPRLKPVPVKNYSTITNNLLN